MSAVMHSPDFVGPADTGASARSSIPLVPPATTTTTALPPPAALAPLASDPPKPRLTLRSAPCPIHLPPLQRRCRRSPRRQAAALTVTTPASASPSRKGTCSPRGSSSRCLTSTSSGRPTPRRRVSPPPSQISGRAPRKTPPLTPRPAERLELAADLGRGGLQPLQAHPPLARAQRGADGGAGGAAACGGVRRRWGGGG